MPRYDGPIVDAHQHFWDPTVNDHPWLRPDVRIPFRYGNYDAIKRRYLPPDYREDTAARTSCQTVYVETEWNPADPIGETRYASGSGRTVRAAQRDRRPGLARSRGHRRGAGGQAAFPLVRSVRHKPGGPASPGRGGRDADVGRRLAARLRAAGPPRAEFRPADAVVEPRRGGGAGAGLPARR